MISAEPANIWPIKNAKFEAYDYSQGRIGETVQFLDSSGAGIGYNVFTDNFGFIYSQNGNQRLLGAFLAQPSYIKAYPQDSSGSSIDYIVQGNFNASFVLGAGRDELFNTSKNRGWGYGSRKGTNGVTLVEGQISFNDIADTLNVGTQIGNSAVPGSSITSGTITDLQIANNANINGLKLADDSVSRSKLSDIFPIDLNDIPNSVTRLLWHNTLVSMKVLSSITTSNYGRTLSFGTAIWLVDTVAWGNQQADYNVCNIYLDDIPDNTPVLLLPDESTAYPSTGYSTVTLNVFANKSATGVSKIWGQRIDTGTTTNPYQINAFFITKFGGSNNTASVNVATLGGILV